MTVVDRTDGFEHELRSTDAIIAELTPISARLVERHLATTKEWFPHELVPWGQGRDFEAGWQWSEEDSGAPVPAAVRSALFVNLLTEDNLPYYSRDIDRLFGADGPWGEWVRRWTAEEGRHAIVIRDYLTVMRLIDPVQLERGRMQQVSGGIVPTPPGQVDGLVYVALQELATRVSHLNTAKAMPDRAGYEVLKRVATDENLHHLYYRDLVAEALRIDPSLVLEAIDRQVRSFQMPGIGIPGFAAHAKAIAAHGIYDLSIHYEQILAPVLLRHWAIDQLSGLDASGEQARDRVLEYLRRLERLALRRAARAADAAPST